MHYFEMVVAMVVGMLVFEPVWETLASVIGPGAVALLDRVDAGALVMATNMTLGMAIWMRVRGHGWAAVAEMGTAMYVPFILLLVPYWFGLLPGEVVTTGGHVLMLPAMLIAMLLRLDEYSGKHQHAAADAGRSTGFLAAVARRWPTWLALVVTIDNWADPMVPPAIAMLLLPSAYLLFGVARKAFRDRRMLVLQIAGMVGYVALVAVALSVQPDVARYLIAAGWLAHAAWDGWHFVVNKVVPRAWSEWCGVVDLVIGLTIIFFL
ncbi:hypothetical protein GCM10027569_40180 [Flindersiella endophytica]